VALHVHKKLIGKGTVRFFESKKGFNKNSVTNRSEQKNEPGWMTDFRLRALEIFETMPMPRWGVDLSELNPQDIHSYIKPAEKTWNTWQEVPAEIKNKFEALGIPQAERKFLAGVGAQYESELVYKNLKKEWETQGVIFTDCATGLRDHEELFKKHFSTVVPADDNKFAALNCALWSGGTFLFVPEGVHVTLPLQAYFRINTPRMGQFERTLIITEPRSSVHYVEGCSAPTYQQNSLHSAVVEIIALPGSKVRYTTIQNWSSDVYNLVTKRAVAHKDATVEWVDGNFGGKCTMKYPCIILQGERAKGQLISVAVAGKGQHQDAGGKIIHLAKDTTSNVVSKSICKDGGRATYRGLLKIAETAQGAKANVQCDALLLDDNSCADSKPTLDIEQHNAAVGHEASVSSLDEAQIFYLQSRGLSKSRARALVVNGFIDAFVKELPMEYAVEINRLISLELDT